MTTRHGMQLCAIAAILTTSAIGVRSRQALHAANQAEAVEQVSEPEIIQPACTCGSTCTCGCADGGVCTCDDCPLHPEACVTANAESSLGCDELLELYRCHHLDIDAWGAYRTEPLGELIANWDAAGRPTTYQDGQSGADAVEAYIIEQSRLNPENPTPAVEPEPVAVTVDELMGLQDAYSLEADAQPTPYEVIFKAIDLLDLENTETLVDFGCGPDARVLTHAFHDTGCRGIGIELDSRRATSARNLVSAAGLSPWIEIVEGDATTESVNGDVGFVYLWPETLEELRPKLQELDRFVSYAHAVPGLDMERIDVPGHEPLWYWERAPEVSYAEPEVSYAERPYAVYNGRRYYSDYNRGCNCSMCRTIRSQLASREHVEQIATQTPPAQSAPQTTTVGTSTPTYSVSNSQRSSYCSSCANGQCGRPMRFRGRR